MQGLAIAACALAMSLGCGADDPEAARVEPTPFDTAAAKARAATKAVAEVAEPAAEESPDAPAAPADAQVGYEPPFPERLNPFEPPKKSSRNQQLAQGEVSDSVVLIGFANVGEPRALLAINGAVKPLVSGEESAGVKVLSITPPRAVLQRGRTRWTASIE